LEGVGTSVDAAMFTVARVCCSKAKSECMGDQLKALLANKGNLACDLDLSCCEWTTVELTIDQMVMLGFVIMVVRACT
jgi:hypothetical protein